MGKRTVLALFVTTIAVPLSGQVGKPPERKSMFATLNLPVVTKLYSLTPSQQVKAEALMNAIFVPSIEKTQAWITQQIMAKNEVPTDSTRKVAAATSNFDMKFRSLLDPKQAERFDSIRGPNRRKSNGGR
jgi:hypothetical protein